MMSHSRHGMHLASSEACYTYLRERFKGCQEDRRGSFVVRSKMETFSSKDNLAMRAIILSKLESTTHNNVVTSKKINDAKRLWHNIQNKFASSQAVNCARIFNDFL